MKSDASQLLEVGKQILMDAAAKCYTATVADWPLDYMQMQSRIKHEGVSFLTITLPSFGAEFEKGLARGKVDPADFPGWKRSGRLPTFLRGFASLVFERDGRLKEEPDVAAIEGIRQISYAFKKILLPCTPSREERAIEGYLQVEEELKVYSMSDHSRAVFGRVCDLLWGNAFSGDFAIDSTIPKHGPGSTSESIRYNQKYVVRTWHERLQPFFPYDTTAAPNTLSGTVCMDGVKFLPEDQELPVKVVLVPKTLKTPRVIAMESVCMQMTQQALAGYFVSVLSTFAITAGHINFSDQTVNQRLALSASADGKSATLDLVSASDRVPLIGVQRMLEVRPDLLGALLATRSKRANIPGKCTIDLEKFASMGSATCFPIEAMYFFSVILTALWEDSGRPLTLETLYDLSRGVYVYGDDIIVPTDKVEVVLSALAIYNCKVSPSKSFWTGKFRESCGVEAYDGEDVTPTYIRQLCPENKRDASRVISWVATSNQFYKKGYWRTAAHMKYRVESVVGKLPNIHETSPGLGWVNYQNGYDVQRWNKVLHRFEVRTLVPTPVYTKDPLDGYPALMKCLLSLTRRKGCSGLSGSNPERHGHEDWIPLQYNRGWVFDPLNGIKWSTAADTLLAQENDHLHRSARYGAASMKSRWTTPF